MRYPDEFKVKPAQQNGVLSYLLYDTDEDPTMSRDKTLAAQSSEMIVICCTLYQ